MKTREKTESQRAAELSDVRSRNAELEAQVEELKRSRDELREREETYREFVEGTRDLITRIDEAGRFTYVNRVAEKIFGLSKEQCLGKSAFDFVHPDDRDTTQEWFKECVRNRVRQASIENRQVNRATGGIAHMLWTSTFRFNSEGRATSINGIAHDITQRKQVEEARRLLSEIAANVSEGVYLVNEEDGLILYANPRFEELYGYTSGELVGKHVSITNAPTEWDPRETEKEIQVSVSRTGSWRGEIHSVRKDGSLFWCHASVSVFDYPEHGKVFVGVHSDVTDLKKAEAALRAAQRDLECRVKERTTELSESNRLLEEEISQRRKTEEELRFLSLITEQVSDSVVATNLDFEITYLNNAFRDLYGYSLAELRGQSPLILNAEPNRDQIEDSVRRAVSAGIVWRGEVLSRKKDGTTFISEIMIFPLSDEAGQIFSYAGIDRDITERKRNEDALRESQELYQALTEVSPVAVYRTDASGNCIYANERWLQMAGISPEETMGGGWNNALHPEDREPVFAEWARAVREERPFRMEYRLQTPEGVITPVLGQASAERDQNGKISGYVGTLTDISERKTAERIMRESEKLTATGLMAARVAHEINNPLAGIKNSFRLVKRAIPEDHRHFEYVERIDREIDRIARIVHQMFGLYHPNRESPSEFSIEETINDVVCLLEPMCRTHEVAIAFEPSSVPTTVSQPEHFLRQVLFNVLINGVEASPRGGVVTICTDVDDGELRISVIDQGDGIPDDLCERVFEPYFTTKPDIGFEGMGIGLSTSRELMESMGGALDFKRENGSETVFRVLVPLQGETERSTGRDMT